MPGFKNSLLSFSAVVSCCSYFFHFFSSFLPRKKEPVLSDSFLNLVAKNINKLLWISGEAAPVLSEARQDITQYNVSHATHHWAKVAPWICPCASPWTRAGVLPLHPSRALPLHPDRSLTPIPCVRLCLYNPSKSCAL